MSTEAQLKAFDTAFRLICQDHKVDACYIALKDSDDKGSSLYMGGVTEIHDYVERAIIEHDARRRAS